MNDKARHRIFWMLILFALKGFSQIEVKEDLIPDVEIKLYQQRTIFGQIHSNGFGVGYRFGKIKSITKNNFQEFEFLKDKHPKAEKRSGRNITGFSRRYIYGGLNQLYVLRYGIGTQRMLNEKPYWGGIQLDYTISAGVALGIAIPQYLRILYPNDSGYDLRTERYDTENQQHNELQYINGGAPLFSGLFHLRPYPGAYGRFAFHFDFGKYQERVNSLEVGAMIDFFPIPIPMMAFRNKNVFFANFYIAYHFGWRK